MEKKVINYGHIARKYFNADVVVHDRTFEGLEWRGPGEKPKLEIFHAFAEEEERQARLANRKKEIPLGLMEEKQAQARALALEEARPVEDKIREEFHRVKEEARKMRMEALELEEAMSAMAEVAESWHEVSKAQEKINQEAEDFLKQTDWYVTRELETGGSAKVPEEVRIARQEARERIDRGRLVYANWQALRSKEMPERGDVEAAIRLGGEALAEIKALCKAIAEKYPRPKRRG